VFTSVAIERIYEITEGVPRKINNLCDLSLLIGFSKNGKKIDPQIIEDIMSDGALL
jgi:type II secretory pathway predicted ATPase ExeA